MRSKEDESRKENKVGHCCNLNLKYSVGLRYKMKYICPLVCVHVHLCIRLIQEWRRVLKDIHQLVHVGTELGERQKK